MDDPNEYKKRTMEAYDMLASHLAEGYDRHFESFARSEADHFLSTLRSERRILDLGCGVGSASRYFAQQGCQSVCADLSMEMVRECQRRGLTRLVRLDMEALPFPKSSFDGIWAHTSLLHIPKDRLSYTIGSLGTLLKPGGVLFIALREGDGEGYDGQPSMERWFSNYQASEFEGHLPKEYVIERFNRIDRQSLVFLNYHLIR